MEIIPVCTGIPRLAKRSWSLCMPARGRPGSPARAEAQWTDQIQRLSAPWDWIRVLLGCAPYLGSRGITACPPPGGQTALSGKRLQNGHFTTIWPLYCVRLHRIPSSPVL